ncbi:Hypothetical predicted protein [Cloeon dipterum]|uniref:alpha-glucosidase n=1 Tax=Cloeon dipterum TaxID=197152 RepID=A0A8S1DMW3_9INSE|nr:Hypothetical predicted protein [Cloeon dipterum]
MRIIVGAVLAAFVLVLAAAQSDLEWWKTTTLYQVYPRSFRDTDADGTGDLLGIVVKLDYFVSLGVGGLLLAPVFKSPMKDLGYDISDFEKIDYTFGNEDDFDTLVMECHTRDLKLVLDFVPNHSSDEHRWFEKSIERKNPYTDYYIWQDPKSLNETAEPIPPNNWLSVYGGSAWEFNEERGQFYLHQFHVGQPDLNYSNPLVIEEMKNILRYWLDKGVDGFRLVNVPHLMEDQNFLDEPFSNDSQFSPDEWGSLSHIYTKDLDELYSIIYGFRDVIDEKQAELGRLLMVEAQASLENTMKYYGQEDRTGAHFPINLNLITHFKNGTTAKDLKEIIDMWQSAMPTSAWPNWMIGSNDRPRVASRFGRDFSTAVVIMSQLLPGTAITYYGEEIDMEDTWISWKNTVDPLGCDAGPENYTEFSRDPSRTPFQWSDAEFAGFSSPESRKPWLPINENYKEVNLAAQKDDPNSPYAIFKALTAMRKNMNAVQTGHLETFTVGEKIFVFTRYLQNSNEKNVMVVVNLDQDDVTADLSRVPTLKSGGMITYHIGVNSSYTSGQDLSPYSVHIPARGSLVFLYTSAANSAALAPMLLTISVILRLL